jgi:hypothetical protein
METPPLPSQKKGLGPLAWLGIGCGGVVGLAILGVILVSVFFGDKIKDFAAEMQKNPTRATATVMVKASVGQLEMVAEDDVNQRYTVREKSTKKLTTIYWDEKTKAPAVIEGDFTAIPAAPAPPADPAPAPAQN